MSNQQLPGNAAPEPEAIDDAFYAARMDLPDCNCDGYKTPHMPGLHWCKTKVPANPPTGIPDAARLSLTTHRQIIRKVTGREYVATTAQAIAEAIACAAEDNLWATVVEPLHEVGRINRATIDQLQKQLDGERSIGKGLGFVLETTELQRDVALAERDAAREKGQALADAGESMFKEDSGVDEWEAWRRAWAAWNAT